MSIVYDYSKLRGLIREHFGTNAKFAAALGIGLTTLHSRLNGETYFNQEEIRRANSFFGVTDPVESDRIFFTHS